MKEEREEKSGVGEWREMRDVEEMEGRDGGNRGNATLHSTPHMEGNLVKENQGGNCELPP